MDQNMKDNIEKEKNMDLEHINGVMVHHIQGIGLKIEYLEKELILG